MATSAKSIIYKTHKYVSLALIALWFVQILTGVLSVFAPEINDIKYNRPYVDLDIKAVEQAIKKQDTANPDWSPELVFTTSKESTRFDVYFYHEDSDEIGSRAIRVDGDGTILADRRMKYDFLNRVAELHENLWIDGWGYILLGISGIFLFTNIFLGFYLIWPQRKQWGTFFKIKKGRPKIFKNLQWHRMLGLVVIIPAAYVVFTGVLNIWLGDMKEAFGDPWAAPDSVVNMQPVETINLSFSDAMEVAWGAYPKATLSIASLASLEKPYYNIRLRQQGEVREIYGNTKMYISAVDGEVLANYDQINSSAKATLFSSFFSLHMGQPFGIFGKIVIFLTGIILLILGWFGGMLWWTRRKMKR